MLTATLLLAANAKTHQLPLPKPQAILGARSPSPSAPTAALKLAFVFHGEIWVAPVAGGRAWAVTNHVEMNDNPVWSPDGQYIAFASNRNGGQQIFVTPSEGGATSQITFYGGAAVPTDWSPDGKQICFVATRDEPHPGVYSVDVESGRTRRLLLDIMSLANPRFSPDGASVVYERMANFPWTRPRYQGSGAAQLWRYDLAAKARIPLAKNGFQHLWPAVGFGGAGVMAVTVGEKTPSSSLMGKSLGRLVDSETRTPNVYAIDGNRTQRLTDFVGGSGTRFLTVAKTAPICAFEDNGDVYTMRKGEPPHKLQLFVPLDDRITMQQHVVDTAGAGGPKLSPKNDQVAFVVHNHRWLVPTPKGEGPHKDDAIQLTDNPGLEDEPIWTPDGKSVFFVSDRSDNMRVFKLDVATKKVTPVSTDAGDAFNLQLSPDKKSLSFWEAGQGGGLFTVPVDGGAVKKVASTSDPKQRPELGDTYAWSPDGKYVAYVQRLTGSGFFYWDDKSNILILDVATGEVHNVTQLSAGHSAPVFSPDGKYLLFNSDRDGAGIYALPLKLEDAREADLELKYEKPKGAVTTIIDFTDIADRSRRIIGTAVSGQVEINPNTGELFFLMGGEVKKAAFNGENVTTVIGGGAVSGFEPSDDWSRLVYMQGGQIFTLELKPGVGPANVAFRADYVKDLHKEHDAAFEQLWRTYNRNYYDPNFHGRDWLAIKKRYEPLLPSVGHRNEMATLLNEMIGEIESSHAEVGPAAGNPTAEPTAQLGFLIDYGYAGPGVKIGAVPPRSVGSYPKTTLRPGEIVTAINRPPGRSLRNEELWKRLANQDGRDITYTVAAATGGATREVKFRAMSGGEWSSLLNRNRIEDRRKYVEAKSNGKLTYVMIPGMNGPALLRFKEEAWQYTRGRQGLIIDVRGNGGGNTADQIIELLERTPHAYYRQRDSEPVAAPGEMLRVQYVVMAAENSYSNAEMFPAAMKDAKLATLVGMPTPGYVIWTGGFQLVDGTSARMPGSGSYRLDGTPLEDNGQSPDYEVDLTPDEFYAGKDPQLDKAIEVLMAKTK